MVSGRGRSGRGLSNGSGDDGLALVFCSYCVDDKGVGGDNGASDELPDVIVVLMV